MLTFEKVRDFERAERESRELQQLPANITEEISDYVKRKEAIVEKSSADLLEIENVKKIIRNFLELREKKIVELALYHVKTQLPVGNLLPMEEKMFNSLAGEIRRFREDMQLELKKETPQNNEQISYRITRSMPEFVGPDMKVYKLNENDIVAELPKPLNELLLKEGVIEEVRKEG